MNYGPKKRFQILVFFGFLLFVYSTDLRLLVPIEEVATPTKYEEEIGGQYYNLTRNKTYSNIELKRVDGIIHDIIDEIEFIEICFSDDGSRFRGGPFENIDVTTSIQYGDETQNVTFFSIYKIDSYMRCFNITDKREITFQWGYYSSFIIEQEFLEGLDSKGYLQSRGHTDLKRSLWYYLLNFALSVFYVGIFIWAWSRIFRWVEGEKNENKHNVVDLNGPFRRGDVVSIAYGLYTSSRVWLGSCSGYEYALENLMSRR